MPREGLSLFEFLAVAFLLLGGTFAGLALARRHRLARDARLSQVPGGWRFRSQLDVEPGDPYNRFEMLRWAMAREVMEGREDGFDVAYFELRVGRRTGHWRPCALVQLPIEGPKFRVIAREGGPSDPADALQWITAAHHEGGPTGQIGTRAAQVLHTMRAVVAETAPFALLVRSTGAPADTVHRTALALAKGIVEDDRDTSAETPPS